ncbi:unnamed protein product [Sphenostylis stenocarpa]|uniref:BHLH domain-containing protein n=1 Tax=Sphenostylis stenocarpa TaxID=92480 RepID=A0AA86SQ41_9FABA|nr:unnamed protein product [Sphenostylis stenocarpa]
MEDSWESWISSLEMGETKSIGQSYINSLDQDKFLNEIDTTMGSSSLSCEDASFDERQGKMLKSNSSTSIISQDVANNASSAPSSTFPFILSFENSSVKPSLHHRPNETGNSPNHFAPCSSLLTSESGHVTKPKAKQGGPKKHRSSSEIQDHIMAERKRRQELTEKFIALSATIPGLKKDDMGETDKAYVLREAIIYMKQLQERVKELENQNKRKTADSRILVKKYFQVCSREEQIITSYDETKSHRSTPSLPQVEARVMEKEVLIGIHCHIQKDIVLKIMAFLQNHHLSLVSSSVLPFGTSTLKVTVIAQMGEKYCTTMTDLVKSLRQHIS